MLDWLIVAIPGLPLAAALLTGLGVATGAIRGEAGERLTAGLVTVASGLSLSLAILTATLRALGRVPERIGLGTWLASGDYRIEFSFLADTLALALSCLFGLLVWLTAQFAVRYMHREPGFHRFFLLLALFGAAIQWLVLAGNAPFTLIGWELAGVCSYLLIAYSYDRPVAAGNATRAFLTNRVGDAGFVLGIFLAFSWTGSVEWLDLLANSTRLDALQATLLAACFLLPAMAKSGQIPFSPWLARALEGPTPSSAVFYGAVMVHAGVYLVIRLQPVFEQSPLTMGLMAALGLATAAYGYFCGLVQTDVKSALLFATVGQLGLMFLECGLGFWTLATAHLAAHAVVRAYQFLSAPSLMHATLHRPARPVPAFMARNPRLFRLALHRFWMEELTDAVAVKPVRRVAEDCWYLDTRVIGRLAGRSPATEFWVGPNGTDLLGLERRNSGLPGALVYWLASGCQWFEQRLVLHGVERDIIIWGRRLGKRLNRLEVGLCSPHYLALIVVATLLACW